MHARGLGHSYPLNNCDLSGLGAVTSQRNAETLIRLTLSGSDIKDSSIHRYDIQSALLSYDKEAVFWLRFCQMHLVIQSLQ